MRNLNFLFKKKLLLATILTAISTLIFLTISGFRFVYSTNDDYLISWLIFKGDEKSLFISYFLESAMITLQKVFPFINCFCVSQIINCVISLIIIDYVVLCKFENKTGFLISSLVNAIVCCSCIIMIQFTHTTTLMCAASLILFLYALQNETRKSYKIIQIICSALFLIEGTMYRFISFEICILFLSVFIACMLLESFFKTKASFLKRLSTSLRKHSKVIISAIILVAVAFGLNFSSSIINNSDKNQLNNIAFNSARASVNDYEVAKYKGNENFYNGIDIYSQEELDLARLRHIDKDFFNTEKLKAIGDYSSKTDGGIVANLKYAAVKTAKKIYKTLLVIKTTLHLPFGNSVFVAGTAFLTLLVLTALTIILRRLKRKNLSGYKGTLRVMAVLFTTLVWAIFAGVFGFYSENILLLAVLAVSIVSALLFNRYTYIYTLILSVSSIALCVYQSYFRTSFRVNFSIVFPVILFLIYSLNKENLACTLKIKLNSTYKMLFAVSGVISAVLVTITCVNIWMFNLAPNIISYDSTVKNYILDNSDKLFLHLNKEYAKFDNGYTNIILPINYPENTLPYGGWQTASMSYEKILKEKGIENLFAEMINSDKNRFIISEDKNYDIINIYEMYYNQHYAANGNKIRLELEKELNIEKTVWFDNLQTESVGIYKVTSE